MRCLIHLVIGSRHGVGRLRTRRRTSKQQWDRIPKVYKGMGTGVGAAKLAGVGRGGLMRRIGSLFASLLGKGSRLSSLEKQVLDCVRAHLNDTLQDLWDRQMQAINKVQRLPGGVDVDFYRMANGRPSFDLSLAFPNKREMIVAQVSVEISELAKLKATVWSVNGFIFQIEYEPSAIYFEKNCWPELRAPVQDRL